MPQLRQSIITGDWVVIAPERAKRPSDYISKSQIKDEAVESCVFEVAGEAYQYRYQEFETDNIFVVGNKYPVFVANEKDCSARSFGVEDFYLAKPSVGGHDVIVVKDHNLGLNKFSENIWYELFEVSRRRVEYFQKVCNVVSAVPIYNHLKRAGASISHPHAQIFAANVVPNLISRELHHTEHYFQKSGSCPFCDMIKHELANKVRMIGQNQDFVAFTAYAARFPFETWIMPKSHQSNFEELTDDELKNLARIMKNTISKLDKTLDNPALNYFIHTLPNPYKSLSYYHWHLEIAPRVSDFGGFELGAEMIIDVMSPEEAAKYLKGEE